MVRAQGSGEIDFGEVQAADRERSDFVRLSGLLSYGSPGEKGSSRMLCVGASAAGLFSAFREQIGWGLVGLGAPWPALCGYKGGERQALRELRKAMREAEESLSRLD